MERLIDMEDRHLCLLRKLLNDHLANKTVWAYGSRAKWNTKQSSDLDLVVWDASTAQITEAIDAFSESNLPFTVQLFAWENTPKDFQEDIRKKYVVLQEGSKIPEGWREAKLGDVVEIIGGGTPSTKEPKYWDGGIPWLTPRDLSNFGGRYITKGERSISELGLHNSNAKLLPKGAVLLTTRAPIGYLAIARNEVTINQGFKGLIASEHTNNLFLYYLLKHNIDYLKAHSSGTTFGELSGITLKSISFCIPPLPEQKAIAEVLSSLDDKIDLLHRQNKTLENIAQTLFRKWFIEDANNGAEEICLGNFVSCISGHSYRSAELQPSNIALVTLKNFARDGSFRMDGYKEFIGKFKDEQIVKQGDLVVSHTDITQEADIIGTPVLVINPGKYKTLIMTMDLMKVTSTEEWLSKEFLFYLFKSAKFKSHCLGCSNGTTVLHMSRKAIPSYKFKAPPKEKIEEFTKIARPNLEKTFTNLNMIRTLEHLQEMLLPKLMNGKASVINEGIKRT